MTVKGVFFDLYGTLFVYGDMAAEMNEWLAEFHACLKNRGLSLSLESFKEYYSHRHSRTEPVYLKDGLTLFEQHIQSVCSDLKLNIQGGEIKITAEALLEVWERYITLDPDCLPVLDSLNEQRKTVGLISNFDHPPYIYSLATKSGLDRFLAAIVISGEVGFRKPDSKIFHIALRRTSLQTHEAIFVGDSEEDIIGANSVGITSVLIDRIGTGKNFGQKHTINSLKDIFNLI
jgi:putative hydrolase of the HAD superfamily